jgi:serine protease Do
MLVANLVSALDQRHQYYWIVKRKQSRRKVLSVMRSVIRNSVGETKMNAQTKVHRTLTACGALAAALMATTALTGFMTSNGPAFAGEPIVVQTNLPGSFSKLIAETRPAVVSVIVKKRGARLSSASDPSFGQLDEFLKRFNLPEGFGQKFKRPEKPEGRSPTGQGSGFFISEDGYIVTNNHVIDGADEIKVRLHDRRTLKAKLIGTDAKTDLAVLKVDGNDFKYVTFGDSDTAQVGDWVVAVGDPFGLSGTATAGIISARGRDIGSGPYDEFMQIDASINKGNSGGPTFNRRGEVVGVNTAIFSPSGGSVGIGFAVPSNVAKGVVDELIKTGKVERGWLGVLIQPISADLADTMDLKSQNGALIADVTEQSPANMAGLQAGDVVVAMDDEEIKTPRDLSKAIAAAGPKEKVKLDVLRDGRRRTFSVVLKELQAKQAVAIDQSTKDADGDAKLGLMLKETGDEVVVTDVTPGSPAANKGLRSGDIIAKVAGKTVTSVEDIQKAVKSAAGKAVLFLVKNKRGNRFIALKPDQAMG